ncbi:MAG: hypothetical protein NVS3B21_18400 [Acidimicrobiales bacterium]
MITRIPPSKRAVIVRIKLLCVTAGLASFLLSVSLWFSGHHDQGIFVGIWVPSIFAFGALLLAGETVGSARDE